MKLWTVQPVEVWQQLQSEGEALVDPLRCKKAPHQPEDELPHIPERYGWLVGQLQQRLCGYTGELPWWAYCDKPDLRWVRHRRPLGAREVRLELLIDGARLARFPSWAWSRVYCGEYLGTRQEERDFQSRLRRSHPDCLDLWPLPQPWRGELEHSWERLFIRRLPRRRRDDLMGWLDGYEAVFERLLLSDVREARLFTGASQRV